MSTDASARASATPDPAEADEFDERQAEYEEMLSQLDQAADACLYKISGDGRVTDPKKEQARSKWVNSLVRVVKERRQVLEARGLAELEREIEEIKAERQAGDR